MNDPPPTDTNGDGYVSTDEEMAHNRALDDADTERELKRIGGLFSDAWAAVVNSVTGLWLVLTGLPGRVRRLIQRTHVRLVVQLVPEDVTDAGALYDLTFDIPPVNADHEHYRRTICLLAVIDRNGEQDLQFAQYLRGLKAFQEDPIRIWIERARAKRKVKPAPAPAPEPLVEPAGLMGPVPLMGSPLVAAANPWPWIAMVSAAIAVLAILFGLWRADEAKDARVLQRDAEARNAGLADRVMMAEESLQKSQVALQDYEKKIAEQQARDASLAAREAAIRRRERERKDAIDRGDTTQRNDDDWLRGLAEAASVNTPVPASPGPAAAPGVLDEVPGAPGGDAGPADRPQP